MNMRPAMWIALIVMGLLSHPNGAFCESESTSDTLPTSISPAPAPGKWQNLWIDRVKLFHEENATLDPNQKNIVFLGDSLTQGFKLDQFFPDLPVLNRGIASDGVCGWPAGRNIYYGVTRRMKECVFDCNPSHVFFLIGTNGVGVTSIPLDYWFGAYQYVVQETQKAFPDVEFILVTCPPSGTAYARYETLNPRVREWNEMIRTYAKEQDLRLIDLYALLVDDSGLLPAELTRDGLHFNQIGFERWAEKVREMLREDGVLKDSPSPDAVKSTPSE